MKKHLALFSFVVLASIGWVIFGGSEKVSAQSSVMPIFNVSIALDSSSSVVSGFSYEGWSCLRGDSSFADEWTCYYINVLPEFDPGLAETGSFDANILDGESSSISSCSDPLITEFIMIRQTGAPVGYNFSNEWNTFCQTVSGWVADGTQIQNAPNGIVWIKPPDNLTLASPMDSPPMAKLAPSVTVQYKTEYEDPDALTWPTYNITFGGLLGATTEAKIPDPTASGSTTVQPKPSEPTLADTGSNSLKKLIFSGVLIFTSISLLKVKIHKKYTHNKAHRSNK